MLAVFIAGMAEELQQYLVHWVEVLLSYIKMDLMRSS